MTSKISFTISASSDFNPHSREGSDAFLALYYILGLDFNPHSREGSDDDAIVLAKVLLDFNPHSREGSDGASSYF